MTTTTLSPRVREWLERLQTLEGWALLGEGAAAEAWYEIRWDDLPPDVLVGERLAEVVGDELAKRKIPAHRVGELTAERLEAFREAYKKEWLTTWEINEANGAECEDWDY